MAVFGNFVVTDYTIEDGVWKIHLINFAPGAGNVNDYYVEFLQTEIPSNVSQATLAANLKTRLAQKINQTYAPLNTAIAANMTVVLP